jgi:hypothetical protein
VRLSIERFVALDGFDRSMALAARAFTTLIPLLIIVAATAEGGDGQSLADQLIERFDLSGATATVPGSFRLHLRELVLRRGARAHRLRGDRRDALADGSRLAAVGHAVDERAHCDELEAQPLDRA